MKKLSKSNRTCRHCHVTFKYPSWCKNHEPTCRHRSEVKVKKPRARQARAEIKKVRELFNTGSVPFCPHFCPNCGFELGTLRQSLGALKGV